MKLSAKFTGNKKITRRYLGLVGGGKLVSAEKFEGATIVEDTWNEENIDARIPRRMVVEVPTGLVMLDFEQSGGKPSVTAGLLGEDSKINWAGAQYISTRKIERIAGDKKAGMKTMHTIKINGASSQYEEVS